LDPLPPSILSCPHCQALYKRSSDFDENGLDHWSDGKYCLDISVDDYLDPVMRCAGCKQLFVTAAAQTKNQWGYSIPKDIKFCPAQPLALEESFAVLKEENLLTTIGTYSSFHWYTDTDIDPTDKAAIRQAGEISMRLAIWTKLNDLRRYEKYSFTKDENQLYIENAQLLLRIIPNAADSEVQLIKAELHRNLGQFIKSLLTLRRIKSSSTKYARKRMVRLNLLLNPNLTKLNRVLFRRTKLGRTLEQLKYKLEDLVDWFRFRKK
jgi:hypothetical protein